MRAPSKLRLRGWGLEAPQIQTARLPLRIEPVPAVTAAYPGCSWIWATWTNTGTSRDVGVPPRTGKVWATAEKVVTTWETVVDVPTFLALSSSLSVPEAG